MVYKLRIDNAHISVTTVELMRAEGCQANNVWDHVSCPNNQINLNITQQLDKSVDITIGRMPVLCRPYRHAAGEQRVREIEYHEIGNGKWNSRDKAVTSTRPPGFGLQHAAVL